jgi:hypothetical protein
LFAHGALRDGPPADRIFGRSAISTMPDQSLDYGRLVERALRQVVRESLGLVAERGLPGRHHHYITFRTDHPGVVIADDLRARYPTEMTIVLQHEFWGLEVKEDRFAVGLSFGGAPHRLEIPLDAVTMFADPSVEFGLQFAQADAAPQPRLVEQPNEPRKTPVADPNEPGEPVPDGGGAEVVTLDRFRKK